MKPSKNGPWTFYTWAEWEVLANQAELIPSFITFKRDIRRITSKKGKQSEYPIYKITIVECPTCEKIVEENQDHYCPPVRETDPTSQGEDYEKWATQFREHNDHIYRRDRRVIPAYETKWIMSIFHDDPTQAHQNADAMYYHISKRYLWQDMRKNIKEYAKTYFQCQQRGSMRQNNQKRTIPPTDIFERWEVDIVGPLPITREGNRYIVVAMDYFSRWPEARPLKMANADTVATFLYEEIICRFGAPRILQSDRGTHFVNELIQRLTRRFRIKHSLSSPYHPQSNGLVERFNKTLCEGIAKLAEEVDQ